MTLLVLSEVGQSGTVVLLQGLMSMLRPAEGTVVDQNAALLLLYSQLQYLSACLSVCGAATAGAH